MSYVITFFIGYLIGGLVAAFIMCGIFIASRNDNDN